MVGWIAAGIGLDVKKFDDEGRSLHVVSVALAGFRRTAKCKVDFVGAAVLYLFPLERGDIGGQTAGVAFEEFEERGLLILVHLRRRQTNRLDLGGLGLLPRLAKVRFLQGDFLLGVIQALEEIAGIIFGLRQDAFAFVRASLDLGGIGAEEARRGSDDLRSLHREIQRQVMSLDAPAPFAGFRRCAENGEEIPFGVADIVGLFRFLVAEDAFQAHDRGGGVVARFAGSCFYEKEGGFFLRRRHVHQRQAFPRRFTRPCPARV